MRFRSIECRNKDSITNYLQKNNLIAVPRIKFIKLLRDIIIAECKNEKRKKVEKRGKKRGRNENRGDP